MRTRADFLNAQRKGVRYSRTGLGLEICPTPAGAGRNGSARVGFTATRKIGGAVERNRAKRRLRAAAAEVLPLYGRERHDYVLVARGATNARKFAALLDDLADALRGGHKMLDRTHRPQDDAAPRGEIHGR